MLYHRSAAEACEDSLVELIDYCYRKFVYLTQAIDAAEAKGTVFNAREDPKNMISQNNV